jgi:hypothetical protein
MRQSIRRFNLADPPITWRLQVPAIETARLDARERGVAAVSCGLAFGAWENGGGGEAEESGEGEDAEVHIAAWGWEVGLGGKLVGL